MHTEPTIIYLSDLSRGLTSLMGMRLVACMVIDKKLDHMQCHLLLCSHGERMECDVKLADDHKPYKDIKSLERGLRIIEALSELGWVKIGQLSSATQIDRSSTYRLVNTLIQLGYVTRRIEDGSVALAPKFAYLADALKDDDIVTQFAWPPLFELSKDILWPSDFATLESGKLLIRLTTHRISPMSIHRGMAGKERLLVRSALGLAILSAMSDPELEATLTVVEKLGGINAEDVRDHENVRRLADRVRAQGYASSAGLTESKISAIALPVSAPDGRVAGAINIIFFRSVMTTAQAAERYLEKLRTCVLQIEQSLVGFAERDGKS